MKLTLSIITFAILLSGCSSFPVYKGSGIHSTAGDWSMGASGSRGPSSSIEHAMMTEIESWIGTPYLYGGEAKSGVDCSAFTQAVYSSVDISIPRTASTQAAASESVSPIGLSFGDLIFFATSGDGSISHVGIYIGNGMFVHASSSNGVIQESLAKEYYQSRIVSAGRFL